MFNKKRNLFTSFKDVSTKNYFLVYFIYFSFFLVIGPIERTIPLAFEEIGFSEKIYGIFLSSINLIHIFLPAIIAYIATKFNSYNISMIAMLICFVSTFTIPILEISYFTTIPLFLLIVCSRTIFNFSLGNSINYALPDNNRGKYFALRDLFLFGSISIGLFIFGTYAKSNSIISFYKFGCFIFLIPLILIFKAKRVFNNTSELDSIGESDSSNKLSKEKILHIVFKSKKFWAFALIELGTITYSSAMNFLPLLGTSLGISTSNVMTMFGAITIVNSIFALIIGHFSDTKGRKWLYVFDLGFDVLPALIFAISNNTTLFVVGIILTMVKDALAPTSFAYFYDCFPEEEGVLITGVISSIGNSLSFVVPIIIGMLWLTSSSYVFIVGAAGNVFAALIAAIMLPDIKLEDESQKMVG